MNGSGGGGTSSGGCASNEALGRLSRAGCSAGRVSTLWRRRRGCGGRRWTSTAHEPVLQILDDCHERVGCAIGFLPESGKGLAYTTDYCCVADGFRQTS